MRPDEFNALPIQVKAFIIAAIDIKADEEKKAEAKHKAEAARARRKH